MMFTGNQNKNSPGSVHLHAAELEAVSVSLVMGGQVVVVENPNAEHSGVNTGAQEEDCDEARHLVDRNVKDLLSHTFNIPDPNHLNTMTVCSDLLHHMVSVCLTSMYR